MFKRSKRKIVAVIMLTLVTLFAAMIGSIYSISYWEITARNKRLLEQYSENYAPGSAGQGFSDLPEPGGKPDRQRLPAEGGDRSFYISIFYSVSVSDDGSVIEVMNSVKPFLSDEEFVGFAKRLIAEGKKQGRADGLRYLITEKQGYTLAAFVDTTTVSDNAETLVRCTLMVGAAMLFVFAFLSGLLADRIIHPLEENDEKQKQFISDAGHELKTPISSIAANLVMLEQEPQEKKWLDNIRYENSKMSALVHQLLDLARAEYSGTVMERTDFSRAVIGELLSFEGTAFEKQAELKSDIEENIFVNGSRIRLAQLTAILLDNAISHCGQCGSVTAVLKADKKYALLSVANTGPEIPAKDLPHLFERFYRSDPAHSDSGHYGLGLAIAKAIAEQHGGMIQAESRNGETVFHVRIPLEK